MKKRINFNEIRNNNFRSFLLFILFLILIGGIGSIVGLMYNDLYFGLIISVIFAIIYSLIVWFAGSKILLTLSNAKPVTKKEYPHLYHSIEGLSIAAGIPVPKAYVIEDRALNAFATGRNPKEAAVVVTTGLMEKLNREELEGVIAHELSHIKNYDIRSMMIAAVMTGVVVLLSDFMLRSFLWGGNRRDEGKGNALIIILALVLAILAPLVAQMIKLAISRKREYAADAGAAVLTRYPKGIANALRKISGDVNEVKSATNATAHMYISSPFKKKGMMRNLFSTHPPVDERIKRLEEM